MSAEQFRQKEGLSFREAYLIPIPVVTPSVDFDDESFKLLTTERPVMEAKSHSSLNVPVAEPAETASLLGLGRASAYGRR